MEASASVTHWIAYIIENKKEISEALKCKINGAFKLAVDTVNKQDQSFKVETKGDNRYLVSSKTINAGKHFIWANLLLCKMHWHLLSMKNTIPKYATTVLAKTDLKSAQYAT